MSFQEYLANVANPENLRREDSVSGETRRDWSGWMRSWPDSLPVVRRLGSLEGLRSERVDRPRTVRREPGLGEPTDRGWVFRPRPMSRAIARGRPC
jgi:hypothetical protein